MADTLPGMLSRAVETYADRDLMVTPTERLTYRAAEEESRLLARALLHKGVGKGSRVGIQLPNGPAWANAWLAVTRIGAIAVPISTFYQPPEMAWILRHADVEILLCGRSMFGRDFAAVLEEALPDLRSADRPELRTAAAPYLRSVVFWGDAPAWASCVDADLVAVAGGVASELVDAIEACVTPADVAVTLYSSGSTSKPKGALHTHGGLVRRVAHLHPFRNHVDADRVFTPMPFFWVGGLVVGLLDCLDAGLTCLAIEGADPATTLRFLATERVTVFNAWPATLEGLRREFVSGDYDLSSVRAGNLLEAVPPELRPKDPLLRTNALGMTETAGPHTWDDPLVELPEELRGSFGRAVPDTEHRVVDPDSGEVLGPGESGEICVRGPNVMLGLHKVERADVFDRDGWYRTGDHGSFNETGHLFFEGRKDELIKTAGVNVSAREVEAALMAFDDVTLAAVVGVPHSTRGRLVAAVVVPEKAMSPTPHDLWDRLRKVISAFTVPRRIWVCAPNEVPMTASGKVDKKSLEKIIESRGELLVAD
ncbi:MAG: class I adenylate-forming enzyme family protein [Candidatus Binatia bacterium]|nr:class I adenylate-forming enzyme family protein [Candidatus Binatia bacterium]